VCDLELLPRNYTASANLIGFNFESTIFKVKHVGLLSKYSRQKSHNRPAEKPAVRCCVTTVEERIGFFAVAVYVAVDPNVSFVLLCYLLEQGFDIENFRLEVLIRIYPLAIQVDARN
jgi:hypothetical protein